VVTDLFGKQFVVIILRAGYAGYAPNKGVSSNAAVSIGGEKNINFLLLQ
jgi:hypothetical protein